MQINKPIINQVKLNDKIVERGFNKIGQLPRDIEYNHSTIFKEFKTALRFP